MVSAGFIAGIYFLALTPRRWRAFSGSDRIILVIPALVLLIIFGTTNGVNLTDGIDGLAAGTVIIALLAFLYIATTRELPDMAMFAAPWPAAVSDFCTTCIRPGSSWAMGSLGLGGALAAVAVLTKAELLW